LRTPQGQAIVRGTDFGTLDEQGRIVSITGFLDETPAAAA
jgi:hypothetical protein